MYACPLFIADLWAFWICNNLEINKYFYRKGFSSSQNLLLLVLFNLFKSGRFQRDPHDLHMDDSISQFVTYYPAREKTSNEGHRPNNKPRIITCRIDRILFTVIWSAKIWWVVDDQVLSHKSGNWNLTFCSFVPPFFVSFDAPPTWFYRWRLLWLAALLLLLRHTCE